MDDLHTVQTFFTGAPTLLGNQSYERFPANQDTDTASDWVVRLSNNATPGLVSIPEPSLSAALIGGGSLLMLRGKRRRQGEGQRRCESEI